MLDRTQFRYPRFLVALAAALCLAAACMQAQPHPSEYQVKAAYLYNFGKFVNWPQDAAQSDFGVCILGDDPFGSTLDSTVANATINGKKVLARRVSKPQDAAGCQIVFVATSEAGRLDRDISALGKLGVLTVSDLPDFTAHGGMIQFIQEDRKVRFEVNLKAAQESGVSLSSELLKVAVKVDR